MTEYEPNNEEILIQLRESILKLRPKGISELIKFLQTEGALEAMSDEDIKNIALMREMFVFGEEAFFGSGYTMGGNIASVLKIAKNSEPGVEQVLSELIDAQHVENKISDYLDQHKE